MLPHGNYDTSLGPDGPFFDVKEEDYFLAGQYKGT